MTKLFVALAAVVLLSIAVPVATTVSKSVKVSQETQSKIDKLEIPETQDIGGKPAPVETKETSTVLTLEAANTVVLRGPVDGGSIGKLIRQIGAMSRLLPLDSKIYLVLDTPGGSVMDGLDFIDFLEGIPQEVVTITLFAASMGFQIAEQNKGARYITKNGVLMSHRARGGVEGQFDGELESQYRLFKRMIDISDARVSARIGTSIPEYKAKIVNEWWILGVDAKREKVADKLVTLRCGETIAGESTLTIQSFFGPVNIVFDNCPLVREPVKIEFGGIKAENRADVTRFFRMWFADRREFVKKFVSTGLLSTYLK